MIRPDRPANGMQRLFFFLSQGFRPLSTVFGPARLFTAVLPSVSDEGDRVTIMLESLQVNKNIGKAGRSPSPYLAETGLVSLIL